MGTFLLALNAVTRLKKTFQKPHTKMAAYVGKYDRISAENYDEFLSELSVNFLLRKAATAAPPVFEVSVEGDVICFKTSTMLKSMELKFKLGEEFDEKKSRR